MPSKKAKGKKENLNLNQVDQKELESLQEFGRIFPKSKAQTLPKEGSASAESNDLVRQLGSHEEHWLHFDSPLLV